MSDVVAASRTQRIVVNPAASSVQVISQKQQRIVVNPPTTPGFNPNQPQQIVINPAAQNVTVVAREQQHIVVTPAGSSVSVINAGPMGPAGVGGGGSGETFRYVHLQIMASMVWDIPHMLGGYPNVTAMDYVGNKLNVPPEYIDPDNVRLTFPFLVDGKAYLS